MIYFFFRKVAMAFRIPATVSLIAGYIHGVLLRGLIQFFEFREKRRFTCNLVRKKQSYISCSYVKSCLT